MPRSVKFLLLFLALALPGLIYVFLKTFGRNEFDVPALYQEGVVPAMQECPGPYAVPYAVPDSMLGSLRWRPGVPSAIVFNPATVRTAIDRLNNEFRDGEFNLMEVPDSLVNKAVCALLLQPDANVVVIDTGQRIRGYYDAADRDETDRLILELKIILKKY